MCGIAAYFGPSKFNFERVLKSIAHRGPDAAGAWYTEAPHGNSLFLLHTRLSILDLSPCGNQPIGLRREGDVWRTFPGLSGSAAADLAIAFNGEIYNYLEIRKELASRGHVFSSTGDTEVLLRAYAEWGEAVFPRLDGMFAVAIFDRRKNRLVLARDHIGIKPLYAARTNDGGVMFSSEVRAIVSSGHWSGIANQSAIFDYLRFGSVQEPATIFEGIYSLEPGSYHWLDLNEGSPGIMHSKRYWSIERFSEVAGRPNLQKDHDELLLETITEQLASDVPIGVFLSGGVDSTAILELASKTARDRLMALTLGGELTANNEGSIAERTAKNLGIQHTLVRLDKAQQELWVGHGLNSMDQPSHDGINTYLVSRAARGAGMIVALSGTGADELHGAYGHAALIAKVRRYLERFGPLAPPFSRLGTAIFRMSAGAIEAERLELFLKESAVPWRMLHEKRRYFTPSQIEEFWAEAKTIPMRWASPVKDEATFAKVSTETQVAIAEIHGYLANTLLRDCDWATMASSQELRVPFLGRRYMEFMLSVPNAEKVPKTGVKKPLLGNVLSKTSRDLVSMPKRGFVLNYRHFLLNVFPGEFAAACEYLNANHGFTLNAPHWMARLEQDPVGAKIASRMWAIFSLGHYLSKHAEMAKLGKR